MECSGCQIYPVTIFRLALDIATERACGAHGALLAASLEAYWTRAVNLGEIGDFGALSLMAHGAY